MRTIQEEHYRRIAYANEHFKSGFAGWKSDRGRVYIVHGPPDEIERHPSGGAYQRPMHEGGGATATYPFEIWRYRHIEGLGGDVELEFVDKTWTEEYRLALTADEKDVFLNVSGHGLTLAEQLGLSTKFDRLQLRMSGANRELYPLMHHRMRDSIFARYETFAKVKRPAEIKYQDLKEVVNVRVGYSSLPFKVWPHYFKLNPEQVLAPVTIEFENKNLSFQLENNVQKARIGVYGIVTSLSNQIVTEFEDDLIVSFQPEHLESGLQGRTLYQKMLVLDDAVRHKLTLVAKDLSSGKIGVVHRGIIPPPYSEAQLSTSSLVLADFIQELREPPESEQMFVLGDVKVRPAIDHTFPADGILGVYLQVYHSAVDQSTLAPSVGAAYRILQNGRPIFELLDEKGSSLRLYSDARAALIKGIPLKGLAPGSYQIEVEIRDYIRNETLHVTEHFQIEG